jgi:predicted nucleic acid-binding protein
VNYVVDASVVIEFVIGGENSATVDTFFERLTSSDRLFVPEFCLLECSNVIWKQARFHGLEPDRAKSLIETLLLLKLRRVAVSALLVKTLEIALRQHLAVYDSCYIALAKQFSLPLVTLDKLQAKAVNLEGVAQLHLL